MVTYGIIFGFLFWSEWRLRMEFRSYSFNAENYSNIFRLSCSCSLVQDKTGSILVRKDSEKASSVAFARKVS